MRNANKIPKIPYSAMVREVKKWYGIPIREKKLIIDLFIVGLSLSRKVLYHRYLATHLFYVS